MPTSSWKTFHVLVATVNFPTGVQLRRFVSIKSLILTDISPRLSSSLYTVSLIELGFSPLTASRELLSKDSLRSISHFSFFVLGFQTAVLAVPFGVVGV